MPIEMNWERVAGVESAVREEAEAAARHINTKLAQIGVTADANPGFASSARLLACEGDWSGELTGLIGRTSGLASKTGDSAQTVSQAEEENRRTAQAIDVMQS